MRHHNRNKKFGRIRKVRVGFIRSLMIALFENGRITTTLARAKAIRPLVEKMITLGKSDTIASRRLIASRLGNNEKIAKKIVDEIAKGFADRPGGYTRIIKMPQRAGDAAPMAMIEFVTAETKKKTTKKTSEKASVEA